ncbi:MAG: hypothetical protein RLZZ500_1859 [Bacteroidota bacterium]|jgi:hypothetical protein
MNPELRSNFRNISVLSIIGYGINKALFLIPNSISNNKPQTPIELLFGIFCFLSLVILSVVVIMKKKSFDNVGMTFLILTSVKMIVAFAVGKAIINAENNSFEKINFYGIFVFFLVIETILTIQLLNKKLEK